MANRKFTAIDSKGQKFEVDDTLKVDESILRTVGEAARGLEETMGAHAVTEYNPLMWIPRVGLKAVAAATDARPSEELQKEQAELNKGKFAVVDREGSVFHVDDTEANRKAVLEQGYKVPGPAELAALTNPAFQGARGAGRAYLESVGNEMLFGLPEMADKETAENLAALRLAHPTATTAGSVAGFAAGTATPGLNMGGAAGKGASWAERGLAKIGIEAGESLGGDGRRLHRPRRPRDGHLGQHQDEAQDHQRPGLDFRSLFKRILPERLPKAERDEPKEPDASP